MTSAGRLQSDACLLMPHAMAVTLATLSTSALHQSFTGYASSPSLRMNSLATGPSLIHLSAAATSLARVHCKCSLRLSTG